MMKEGEWKFGDLVETVLENKEGEVVATRETKKVVDTHGSARKFSGRRSGAPREGDKCQIM